MIEIALVRLAVALQLVDYNGNIYGHMKKGLFATLETHILAIAQAKDTNI